jgi:NTP pyrophosphatase (non-canonical NTP hydrolase)
MNRQKIYKLIDEERTRQAEKWNRPHDWGSGDCSSPKVEPIVKLAVLHEETGEVARAVLEHNHDMTRMELVEVAAVAVAWLESFDAGQAEFPL